MPEVTSKRKKTMTTTSAPLTPFDMDCGKCGSEASATLRAAGEFALSLAFPMYICGECGSKRCAKASDHEAACDTPKQCASCASTNEVTFAPDPYAEDVHGDSTPAWLCASCRHESLMDI